MIWIESIMAFAVTMMAFSTIVSMIVEMLHRMFRLREDKLKQMLDQIHKKLILPKVESLIKEMKTESPAKKTGKPEKGFAEKMTDPDFIPEAKSCNVFQLMLHKFLNPKNTKKMSALEFVEKLARTKEGRALMEKSRKQDEGYLKNFLDDLVSQYEKFEESAREYFTRRARFFSVIIAIGLAVSININPIEIFDVYLKNTKLRNNIVSQGQVIGKQIEAQQQRLTDMLKKADKDTNEHQLKEDQLKEIKKIYGDINTTLETLQKADIPFGWETPGMKKVFKAWDPKWGFLSTTSIKWFLSVVLGGFLVGLGGPFWFDLFKKMSVFVGFARNLPSGAPKDAQGKEVTAGSGSAPEERIDPLTLFKQAAKAYADIP